MAPEQGRIVTNEKTGEKAWWDGQNLQPIRIAPGTNMEGMDSGAPLKVTDQPPPGNLPSPDDQLLKQAQQGAVKEAQGFNKSMMSNLGVPLAQAGLGLATGGMSLPAQALIGGAAELAAQKMGYSPESTTQVGLASAIPAIGPALTKGLQGGAKAVGKMFSPGATRNAGVEAAVSKLGEIPDVVERVKTPTASSQAYKEVGKTFTEVPTGVATRSITSAVNLMPKSSTSKGAVDYLEKLATTLDAEGNMPYERMAAEISGMRTKAMEFAANKDFGGAAAVRSARKKIIEEMDKISPDLSSANALYKKEHSISKIEDALTKPRADVAFKQLIKKDKLIADMPEADLKMVEGIANQLTKIGSTASPYSGVGGRTLDFLATPLSAMIESDTGRAFLRKMFKGTGNITPAGISSAVQFWRAYEAQGGDSNRND